jgi:Polyketide cyclase / dehydrase and lipid transport
MADGRTEITIRSSPDDVWKLVGDFGGIAEWVPGIESCALDGDVRVIKMMGIEIHEQLRDRDEADRRLAYSIVQSPMPLQHHLATITVSPDGDASHVTYALEIRPDELLNTLLPVYEGMLQTAKANLES